MLNLESLPDDTRLVFDFLRHAEQLRAFTLIGGTALALQFNHRRSGSSIYQVGWHELSTPN